MKPARLATMGCATVHRRERSVVVDGVFAEELAQPLGVAGGPGGDERLYEFFDGLSWGTHSNDPSFESNAQLRLRW
jgi:hypothetical protein